MDGSSLSMSGSSESLVSTRASGSSSAHQERLLQFACNICQRTPPANPVMTACGHSFCWWPCMCRFLRGQPKPCPVCTTMLCSDINDMIPIRTNNGSLMLYLPTMEYPRVVTQVKRSEDNLIRMRTI